MSKKIITCAALTAAALAASAYARGGNTVSGSQGELVPAVSESRIGGSYKLHRIASERRQVERVQSRCRHLDATKDELGNRPTYSVFLVNSDASVATDFGAMRMNKHGNAKFKLDTRKASLPEGVTTVSAYDGGRIEIRDGAGAPVLSAPIAFIVAGSKD